MLLNGDSSKFPGETVFFTNIFSSEVFYLVAFAVPVAKQKLFIISSLKLQNSSNDRQYTKVSSMNPRMGHSFLQHINSSLLSLMWFT